MQNLNVVISTPEREWISHESIRRVLLRTKVWALFVVPSFVLTSVMAYETVGLLWILIWFSWMMVLYCYILHIKSSNSGVITVIDGRVKPFYVTHLGNTWFLLGLGWGTVGLLFFTQITAQKLFIVTAVLCFNIIITVFDISKHSRTAILFINSSFGAILIGAAYFIAFVYRFDVTGIYYFYMLAVLIVWYVVWIFNKQLFETFCLEIILQYRNTQLIANLRQETAKLELEKISALQANETIKRFFSSAAHDIRQPVYALTIYANFLKDTPEQAADLIPKITSSCLAINGLFESLFEYEKIKSTQLMPVVEKISLTALFTDLQQNFESVVNSKNLTFRIKPMNCHFLTDSHILKRILKCLVGNAIKYTSSGGVLLAVRRSGNGLSFEVWDTGVGIENTHHSKIFDEFYKVGEHSSSDEGFGLGLSVAKRLAAHIDGSKLTFQSQVGRGSVFKFHVPSALL